MVLNRPLEFVIIPMIAFIERGMELPMGRVTRDYLINYRLTPTQCSPNIFRILECVDAINRRIGINLTWHDVNWVYNYQKREKTKYYMKCRVLAIKLIFCQPDSSKGIDEDFFLSREVGMMEYIALPRKGNQVRFPRTEVILRIFN